MAFEPIRTVQLTDEELSAAQAFVASLTPPGQQMVVKEEDAEEMRRALYAAAILGLADRRTTEGKLNGDQGAVFRGQTAAVKAFALYPIAVNIYECARILACSAKAEEAKVLFADFLARIKVEPSEPIRDRFTSQHDLDRLQAAAKLFLATGIAPVT